ncbi:MAG: PP2C family protein-serine/threonine phosphatase [Planctomycetota bacterium]
MAAGQDNNFFRVIPKADLFFIAGAIAMLFAPLWAVLMARVVAPGRLWGFLTWCALAGLTAAAWFLTLHYRRVFLPFALGLNLFVVLGGYYFETRIGESGGWFGPGTAVPVPTPEGLLMLGMFVASFVMILVFLSRVATPHLKMRSELAVASEIHAALVGPIDRTIGPIAVAARSEASSTMGGDLVDVIEHDGSFDLVLADVTGHGVKAGVVMSLAKGVIHAHLKPGVPIDAASVGINADLCRLTESGMFVTAVLARVERAGESVRCRMVIAGHPPVFVLRGDRVDRVESTGLPLGVDPDAAFQLGSVELAPGDRLCVYSDGLTEAVLDDGRQLGVEGLERIFSERAGLSAGEQVRAVLGDVPARHAPELDDRTIAVLAFDPAGVV